MKYLLLLFFSLSIAINAQVTGHVENFDNGAITGFVAADPTIYNLSNDAGALKVVYSRTSGSDQWGNFNYTPAQTINMTNNPVMVFKMKSTVSTTFSFKNVNDNSPSLIGTAIPGDNSWHIYVVKLTSTTNQVLKQSYMYFDGGTTTPKTGTIWFDEIRFGDSAVASVPIDWNDFDKSINFAEKLMENSSEGTQEGEFPIGSKSTLQSVYNSTLLLKQNNEKNQKVVDQAVWDLYDAMVNFEKSVNAIQTNIIDPTPTKETRYLYSNMLQMQKKSIMFGMHHTTGYGVGWSGDNDRSDINDVVGDFPAVFSEDLLNVELGSDVDGMRYRLTSAYEKGAVITICWHQYDYTGTHFYTQYLNDDYVVEKYVPGGAYHEQYKEKLKRVAKFFKSFRGSNGESIPILFRPYHEHLSWENQTHWFWWGSTWCTKEQYNTLWQFTVDYLRDTLNVHNLIYVISPSLPYVESGDGYFTRYPGDNYVDIFGIDDYEIFGYKDRYKRALTTVANHALAHNKPAAISEIGLEGMDKAGLFTDYFLEPVKNDPITSNYLYLAVWRNESTSHAFAPYPGHPIVPDFIKFYNDPYTSFMRDLPKMYQIPTEDKEAPVFVSSFDSTMIFSQSPFTLNVDTDERAFLRYSYTNVPFENMTQSFATGEGSYKHSVELTGEQGIVNKIFVHAKDTWGNVTTSPLEISFKVDTLSLPIAWTNELYPETGWNNGNAKLGTGDAAATKINPVKTAYFKKKFTIDKLPTATAVVVSSQGGMVVYINNYEVARFNLPTEGEIGYETNPTSSNNFTRQVVLNDEARSKLRIGENLIAIEVHNGDGNSISTFDAYMVDQANKKFFNYNSDWLYFDKGYRPADKKLGDIVSVEETAPMPTDFVLYGNYPNPFNPTTKIKYQLAQNAKVQLEVYDILGARVNTIVNKMQDAGVYELEFNGRDLASGVYTVILRAGNYFKTHKMMLIK